MEFLRAIDPSVIERWGGGIFLGFVLVLILLERLNPYRRGMKLFREGFWMDLVWYTIIQSYFLKIIIFSGIILPIKNATHLSEHGIIGHWPIWLLLVFFTVTHDLYIYWFHRWQHNNAFLWKTHEAHHSAQDVDWLAGSRSHPLEILINQTIEFLPIIFLLDAATASILVPLKALVDALWGTWIHSNTAIRLGKFIYVFNGPEMHQWHHANHMEVFYSNYATKFSLFDWLFGTAFLPGKSPLNWPVQKPLGFGLPYSFPKRYFQQLFFFFRTIDLTSIVKAYWPWFFRWLDKNRSTWRLNNLCNRGMQKWTHADIFQFTKVSADQILCPRCSKRMMYFYEADQAHWHCGKCELKLSDTYKKFGLH